MTAWWVGPAAQALLALLLIGSAYHWNRLAARPAGALTWRQFRASYRRQQRAEHARFLALAKAKQARRDQRQRELGHRDWKLGLARWTLWVIEPGPDSFSITRDWLAGWVTDRVQAADWHSDRDYQRHQGRQEARDFREVRADYRDRLARGQVVLLTDEGDLLLYSLRGAHLAGLIASPPPTAKSHRTRYSDFPAPAHRHGSGDYYRPEDLRSFYQRHPELGHPAPLPDRLAVVPLTGDYNADFDVGFLHSRGHRQLARQMAASYRPEPDDW